MVRFRWRDPFLGNSFADVDRLRREMNRLFDVYHPMERLPFGTGVFPPVNVYMDQNAVYVTSELPGMNPAEIDISVRGDNLVLKGERKTEADAGEVSYHRRERRSGTFNRVLTLPDRVNAEKVTAEYKNGMLKITLPKQEEAKPKQIEVKAQ